MWQVLEKAELHETSSLKTKTERRKKLRERERELPYDSAIQFLGIYSETPKNYFHIMFIAVLSMTEKKWNQLRCLAIVSG